MNITYEPQTPTPQPIDKENIMLDDRCIGEMKKGEIQPFVCTLSLSEKHFIHTYGAGDTKEEAFANALNNAKGAVIEATSSLAWIETRM